MPDGSHNPHSPNPFDLWQRWVETAAASAWQAASPRNSAPDMDLFGLFSAFAPGVSTPKDRPPTGPSGIPDPVEMWKQWFTAALNWSRVAAEGAQASSATAPRQQAADADRDRSQSGSTSPLDPIAALQQWYEAISQAWSQQIGAIIGNEAFVEMASRSLQMYASPMQFVRRASEKRLHDLQLPTRADIARVASLIVALEDKVERIEDALDERPTSSARSAQAAALDMPATLAAVEERLGRVETRMDALLAMMEQVIAAQQPIVAPAANGTPRRGRVSQHVAASERVESQAVARSAGGQPRRTTPATRRRRTEPAKPAAQQRDVH